MKKFILWIGAYLFCFCAWAQDKPPTDLAPAQQLNAPAVKQEPVQNVLVYPNPSTGKVFLSLIGFKGKRAEVRVMNVIGNVVLYENFYETEDQAVKTLDLTRFASGLYYVKLEAAEYTEIRKVIIN